MNQILEQVCVVIISRGREMILTRSIEYWSKLDVHLVIVHKTDTPLNISDFSNKVNYINHSGSYAERCRIASESLVGKFCIVVSDDELYVPSGLAKLANKLETTPLLTSVGGQTIAVMKYGKRIRFTTTYMDMHGYRNSYLSAFDRLQHHFYTREKIKNSGAMYRMFRKADFQIFLLLLSSLNQISTPYIFEITSEIFWTAKGPSEYMNQVFWIRNWIEPPLQRADWDRKLYFHIWYSDKKYSQEVQIWKTSLKQALECDDAAFSLDDFFEQIYIKRRAEELVEISRNKNLKSYSSLALIKILRYFKSILSKNQKIDVFLNDTRDLGLEVEVTETKFAVSVITMN